MSRRPGGQIIDKVPKTQTLPDGSLLCNIYWWKDFFKCKDTSQVSHRFKNYGLTQYGHKHGDGHKYWSYAKVVGAIYGI